MVKKACHYLALAGLLSATEEGGVHCRSLSDLFSKIFFIIPVSSWATHIWPKSFSCCTYPWLILNPLHLLASFFFRGLVAVFHISDSWFSQSRQKYFLCYLKQRLLSSVIFIVFEHSLNYSPYFTTSSITVCEWCLWNVMINVNQYRFTEWRTRAMLSS